jgi:hypothetical protein
MIYYVPLMVPAIRLSKEKVMKKIVALLAVCALKNTWSMGRV